MQVETDFVSDDGFGKSRRPGENGHPVMFHLSELTKKPGLGLLRRETAL